MVDILEGLVLEVVDGNSLELDVERVEAEHAGSYGGRVIVRLADGVHTGDDLDDEAAARMELDYENRRVRCYVTGRDDQGRIIGEVEVLGGGEPAQRYGTDENDETTGQDET